ncbi:LutC/YkgG family protein [Lunatimonas salinarum]|uniref:LutC/YkgG family protein n=1 Tax=Lunatimonas salinarum TaxID=1774590 RepID=UPI001ADF1793|nr:LUD domain-containing protein [Lunatimonas salinarum]
MTTSRKTILDKVRKNKPNLNANIDLSPFLEDNNQDVVQRFRTALDENGGKSIILENEAEIGELISREINGNPFVDCAGFADLNVNTVAGESPKNLAKIKTAIVRVELGVAENGAIWLEDKNINGLRILPFIVENGIFILPKAKIVPTMHHAYRMLNQLPTGFGTFIAGPSKTGDIEQHLVVGAHGPLSHLVILI